MNHIISAKNITHSYEFEESTKKSLQNVSLDIREGELIAILGRNGCGKSTLAKHFNGLIPLQKGKLTVGLIDASRRSQVWELRRKIGMVFQNPDNQFVSSIVEEDVAFGMENYNIARREIPSKVKEALKTVGMEGYGKHAPYMLSGGQKQRIALAGVLALDPDILIFDESTSMLDPKGREEILSVIRRLHEQEKRTILLITHYIEESVWADRVCLMREGEILAFDKTETILTDMELMKKAGLSPPLPVRLYYDLKKEGICLKHCPLTKEELVDELCQLL